MPDADVDARRVHAVLLWPTPAPPPRPTCLTCCPPCSSTCTATWGQGAEPIARLEGHGPVTEAWISRVLGPNAKFKIHPVLDLAGQAPVDAYEIPTDIDRPCI